ncbi:MAG TPA: hypothetical protein VMU22_08000 [Rhizomicrobium sp.]|nr:hypothetical protein [Rhizomicrobium sp.]
MRRWFGPKIIGVGIGPRSWEGWLATLVFAGGGVVLARWLHPLLPKTPVWAFELPWLALFLLVVALTYGRDADD